MTDHSILAPSSAERWVHCFGSVLMERAAREAGQVKIDTEETIEGEAAHEIAGKLITEDVTLWTPGMQASNGVMIDAEMMQAAKMYADHVRAHTSEPTIEQRLSLADAIHPTCFGTPDCWGWSSGVSFELNVWDFKYGHLFVDAFENWQCICYTLGILSLYPQVRDEQVTVCIHVIQPRNYDKSGFIRTWRVKASDLRAHQNMLRYAAQKALEPNPETKATPEGCRDCVARHRCPTLQRAAMEAAHIAGQATPIDLSAFALGNELKELDYAQKMLAARMTGLTEQALLRAKKGENIPYWEITESKPRQRWIKPVADVVAMGELMGKDLRKAPEAVTPAQARKLGIDESVINLYSDRPRGELQLTRCDTSLARKVFSQ